MNKGKQVAALGAFARAQREENRRRLIAAARRVFERSGYLAPSVDDIAQEAGVSRQTFYRHFDVKLAVGMEFFAEHHESSRAVWSRLSSEDARNPKAVHRWLSDMLATYEDQRNALRDLVQMGIVEPAFSRAVKNLMRDNMAEIARHVPAFRQEHDDTSRDRERFADAWLLVDQILEQFNSFVLDFSPLGRADLIDALSRSFSRFIERNP